jgi:hypothetical protein
MASANSWEMTHNDLGSGPLHMGTWFCAFSFDNVNGPRDSGVGGYRVKATVLRDHRQREGASLRPNYRRVDAAAGASPTW